MDIKAAFKAVDELYKTLEPEYEKYITDKKIDIFERWDFFVKAPSLLKVKEYAVSRIDTTYFNSMKKYWYNSDTLSSNEIVKMAVLFRSFTKDNKINVDYHVDRNLTEDDIKQSMEFILKHKIESIIYDFDVIFYNDK